MIITGHQPQEGGYLVNGDQHLIIASDHNQGVFLPLNLTEEYDIEKLVAQPAEVRLHRPLTAISR